MSQIEKRDSRARGRVIAILLSEERERERRSPTRENSSERARGDRAILNRVRCRQRVDMLTEREREREREREQRCRATIVYNTIPDEERVIVPVLSGSAPLAAPSAVVGVVGA